LRQRPFFGDASLLAQPCGRPSSSGRQLQAAVSNVAAPDQKTMEKAVFGKGKVVKVRGGAARCRHPPAQGLFAAGCAFASAVRTAC
jgi:hypothetical protein